MYIHKDRLGFFHILQNKLTVKHKPKIAEDDAKQA